MYKSNQSDKIKCNFFQAPSSSCVISTIWMHPKDADKVNREKPRQELNKNATCYSEQILEATSHETTAVKPPNSYF